jgi:serine/threonine protein kinase
LFAQNNHALPPGCELGGYRIEKQLSVGGFSIVYLAHDAAGPPVAIKEYMPNALSLRGEGEIVPNIPPEHQGDFNHGLKLFFEEGRALTGLDHPTWCGC